MRNRVAGALGAATLVIGVVLWAPVLAQTPSGAAPVKGIGVREAFDPDAAIQAAIARTKAAAETANWTPPRTPWGDPDLQGYWLLSTYTPLERPKELAGKPLYTEEEAVAAFRKAVVADAGVDPRTVHFYEFACHEHNYGLINLVVGSQIRERERGANPGQSRPASPVDER